MSEAPGTGLQRLSFGTFEKPTVVGWVGHFGASYAVYAQEATQIEPGVS